MQAIRLVVILALASACATTPPPQGVTVVEPERPPASEEEITLAQQGLRERGFYLGPIDGELTAETQVAIARFQRSTGLEVTGVLDEVTLRALPPGETPERDRRQEPEEEAPRLPSAEVLLREPPPLPQPPPEALAPVLAEAERNLEVAGMEAAALLAGTGEGAMMPLEERLARAQLRVASARREAFGRILARREEGGWALLPDVLAAALRQSLADRNLLLREGRRGWGRDEEAAIRWLERSLQLPVTGKPSLVLLEALGIDPSPMFQP